jgi:hypothetical protein
MTLGPGVRLAVRHARQSGLVPAIVLAAAFVAPMHALLQPEFYPHTKRLGRALAAYEDAHIHIVVAYYYSQRNHDSRWILLQAGVSTRRPTTVWRDDIELVMPSGRPIPLAAQRRWSQDAVRAGQLLQAVTVTRRDLGSYFRQSGRVRMRFFTFPVSETVQDEFVVDGLRFAYGDLLFESPTGRWQPGTYTLMIRHQNGRVALPIELE